MNKKELIYNLQALFFVWLNGKEEVEELELSLSNSNGIETIPCNSDNMIGKAADILYNKSTEYDTLSLCGREKGKKTIFGTMDII